MFSPYLCDCCAFNHISGCKLSEFERVTALKVYNWFANRRKEMKRRANIGEGLTCLLSVSGVSCQLCHTYCKNTDSCSHWLWAGTAPGYVGPKFTYPLFPLLPPPLLLLTQPEAAILESHGIEVASPSCHSNGEDGEMHEFTDQVNHRFSEQVSQLGGVEVKLVSCLYLNAPPPPIHEKAVEDGDTTKTILVFLSPWRPLVCPIVQHVWCWSRNTGAHKEVAAITVSPPPPQACAWFVVMSAVRGRSISSHNTSSASLCWQQAGKCQRQCWNLPSPSPQQTKGTNKACTKQYTLCLTCDICGLRGQPSKVNHPHKNKKNQPLQIDL